MKDRVILHCDCNGFFASVETLLNPELAKVPMAVAGDPESRHGIILAKNELAKPYGIQTAETVYSAKQKCPQLVLVLPHHKLYGEVSRKVNAIYLDYTDLVDPFGIDESFLDVTGSMRLFDCTPKELADRIRARVREEIGITISVGVSFCRVFAKLGSDYKKPDATTVMDRENYQKLAFPLPVSALLFAGRRTTDALRKLGILTIGDLAAADRRLLAERLGHEDGEHLKVPHMGWNKVQQVAHPLWAGIADNSRFYFVHSYYVQAEKPEQIKGHGHYGVDFAAAMGEDNVFAVQFHPEKSHHAGLALLRNFLAWDGQA